MVAAWQGMTAGWEAAARSLAVAAVTTAAAAVGPISNLNLTNIEQARTAPSSQGVLPGRQRTSSSPSAALSHRPSRIMRHTSSHLILMLCSTMPSPLMCHAPVCRILSVKSCCCLSLRCALPSDADGCTLHGIFAGLVCTSVLI